MTQSRAERQLARLKRRHGRKLRVAQANGFLAGVCATLKPGDIVIDCGANIGSVTKQLAATGATVHSFEPDPFTFAELEKNCADLPNVVLHNAAVGVENSTVQLLRDDNFEENPLKASVRSTVVAGGKRIDETSAIDVQQINLLEFFENVADQSSQIKFVKLDIEGAELPILEALAESHLLDQIGVFVVETHEHKFQHLRPRFAAVRSALAGRYPSGKINLDWI